MLYIITGYHCSGKSTIKKKLISNFGFNNYKTKTNRKKRPHEEKKKDKYNDYLFGQPIYYKDLALRIDKNGVKYSVPLNPITNIKNYVIIVDWRGALDIYKFYRNYGIECKIIDLITDRDSLFIRFNNRERKRDFEQSDYDIISSFEDIMAEQNKEHYIFEKYIYSFDECKNDYIRIECANTVEETFANICEKLGLEIKPKNKNVKKIYIAGKIDGDDNYVEHFNQAEKDINDGIVGDGWEVINPVRFNESLHGFNREEFLYVDLAILSKCDAIYMLDTWKNSDGARTEFEFVKRETANGNKKYKVFFENNSY